MARLAAQHRASPAIGGVDTRGAGAPHPRPRRDARRRLPRRDDRARGARADRRGAVDAGPRPGARGDAAGADRGAGRATARGWWRSTPASRRSIVRNLTERGVRSTLLPCTTAARRGARARARRGVPRQRPRRPGRARLRRRHRARAGREGAGVRHLPRPPAAVPRGRPRDLQAALRPPRRQPPGQGPRDRQDRDHGPEPRLRGGRPRRRAARSPATSRCAGRPTSARPSCRT